jgi:cyclopropane fatty-acyl-phospholipid synthase-like methyltransferase
MEGSKNHWNNVYNTKKSDEVSWTQAVPKISLDFLHSFNLSKDSPIIDIGGGESKLADFLLDEGFTDITVLDISEQAVIHCKERLGPEKAAKVQWIVSDITEFVPARKYQVWHDRATFHFLTTESQIARYVRLASNILDREGYMTIGTFSENGPTKCSGLPVKQYSEELLSFVLTKRFEKIRCITEDHETPFHTFQTFLFCSFRKVA